MARPQKKIKIDQLISVLRECFQKVQDPPPGSTIIPLDNFLMSSYAVFFFKISVPPALRPTFEGRHRTKHPGPIQHHQSTFIYVT